MYAVGNLPDHVTRYNHKNQSRWMVMTAPPSRVSLWGALHTPEGWQRGWRLVKESRDLFDDFADEIKHNVKVLHQQGASDAECRNFEIMSELLPLIGFNFRIMRPFLFFCVGSIIGSLLSKLLDTLLL